SLRSPVASRPVISCTTAGWHPTASRRERGFAPTACWSTTAASNNWETGAMRYLSTVPGKQISKIGLGTWQFGSREWGYGSHYADEVAQAIVGRALELGVTLFDTAEIYGFGRSERILGQALGENLESVFLATKILPVLPIAPVVEQRAVASANRLGARRLDL